MLRPLAAERDQRMAVRLAMATGFALLLLEACAPGPPTRHDPLPPPHLQEGIASWYGKKFAGRPTASGEIFDPSRMTAASRSLPLGCVVQVTNMSNGRQVLVRINDRGPFTRGRVLDCSEAAARRLGFREHGTTRVLIEWPPRDTDPGELRRPEFWIEVGVFESARLAREQRARVLAHLDAVELDREGGLVRVLAGPYSSRWNADRALERAREAGYHAALVVGEGARTARRAS